MISLDEIIKLNAGREIDILLAQQIMGWQLETDEPKLRKLQGYFSRDEARRWWRNPEGGWYCDPPSYSSNMIAAWQVVEMMNSNGQALFLSQSSEENNVAFDEPRATSPDYISEKSVTVAICKAALTAHARRVQMDIGIDPISRSDIPVLAGAGVLTVLGS